MPDGDVLLEVRGLKVHFPIEKGLILRRKVGLVRAVDGVDFTVRNGRGVRVLSVSPAAASPPRPWP